MQTTQQLRSVILTESVCSESDDLMASALPVNRVSPLLSLISVLSSSTRRDGWVICGVQKLNKEGRKETLTGRWVRVTVTVIVLA